MSTPCGLNYVLPSVAAEDGTIYGYAASALQSDITVENGVISGELKYVTTGDLADWWGAGNFLALEFGNGGTGTTATKVGLIPSKGSGFVALDEDRNAAAKIDSNEQQFACIAVKGHQNFWQIFKLDLTLDAS